MRKQTSKVLSLMALAVSWLSALHVWATPIPILNPGFDAMVVGQSFTYETVAYNPGDPMPDHTFTLEDISGNGDNISGIGDSATGAPVAGATIEYFGYIGSPGSGLLHDTRDYQAGHGPDGPGGLLSFADNSPRGIFQLLTTDFAPNTTYTFTAEVSDRRFGSADNVSFPNGGATVPQGVQLSLAGDVEPVGTFTFVQPLPGETSLATFVYSTGPAGTPGDPTGPITLVIRTQGFAGLAATQVVFDNLTLDAVTIPEPSSVALLSLGGLAALALVRRRASQRS